MIRPITILWTTLAATAGFGLFHLKHEVQALEDELVRLNRQILAEQQSIHVLKAEWAFVNQPHRLEALAQRYLDLEPLKPRQVGRVADLPPRPAEDALADAASPSASPAVPPSTAGSIASSAPRARAGTTNIAPAAHQPRPTGNR
jgi:hypothetical protein